MPLKHLISEAKGVPLDRQEDANDMGTGLKDLLVDIHTYHPSKRLITCCSRLIWGGILPKLLITRPSGRQRSRLCLDCLTA